MISVFVYTCIYSKYEKIASSAIGGDVRSLIDADVHIYSTNKHTITQFIRMYYLVQTVFTKSIDSVFISVGFPMFLPLNTKSGNSLCHGQNFRNFFEIYIQKQTPFRCL